MPEKNKIWEPKRDVDITVVGRNCLPGVETREGPVCGGHMASAEDEPITEV